VPAITVIKRDSQGRETWRYTGQILERGETFVRLEARFNREQDYPFQDTVLRVNDRFVETFYTDRWYNIFEIHDRDDDRIKGWYCNVGRPAVWEAADAISYVDLALDLWVSAAGWKEFLDWDEYARLRLDAATRARVREALYELAALFESKRPPA
jgi:protein associated with RNAse G/E